MAAEAGARENKILLQSEDGLEFAVSEPEAIQSNTIETEMSRLRRRNQPETPICLDVDGKTLSKVIQYFKKHAGGCCDERDIYNDPDWETKFIDVDNETLCDLVNVSYLHPQNVYILLYNINLSQIDKPASGILFIYYRLRKSFKSKDSVTFPAGPLPIRSRESRPMRYVISSTLGLYSLQNLMKSNQGNQVCVPLAGYVPLSFHSSYMKLKYIIYASFHGYSLVVWMY